MKKILLVVIVSSLCIGCDQVTKDIARTSFVSPQPISLLNGALLLQYAENHGGMLSVGATLSDHSRFWIFTVFVSLLLIGILVFVFVSRTLTTLQSAALAMIVGGGFSNLLDRLFNDGAVIDFLNVGIGQLRTGVFNLADVVILFGTFVLIVSASRLHKASTRHPDA